MIADVAVTQSNPATAALIAARRTADADTPALRQPPKAELALAQPQPPAPATPRPSAIPQSPAEAPTASGIDKDRPDYAVYCGEWNVGRIYQTRGGPESLRWVWSLTVNGPMTRSDKVATLEEAKAQFQKSWDAWKAWAKLEETP
jgi:hypothetical protein